MAAPLVGGAMVASKIDVYSPEVSQFFQRIAEPTAARKASYATLIDSLVSNSIWTKLDVLYILAAADSATALTNLKQRAYTATEVNSPTFTADVGYAGNGTSSYLDSNFNPTTAPLANYVQNSACMFVWSNTSGNIDSRDCGYHNVADQVMMYVRGFSLRTLGRINASGTAQFSIADGSAVGLATLVRSGAAVSNGYFDTTKSSDVTEASGAMQNANFVCLHGSNEYTTRQQRVFGFGSSLSDTDVSNLQSALSTYLGSL